MVVWMGRVAVMVARSLCRLLLAVCEHWCLWEVVRARLDDFLQHPGHRVKGYVKDLGHLVPLLSLSPRHTWRMMVGPLLSEAMDRSVLWICAQDQSLIKVRKIMWWCGCWCHCTIQWITKPIVARASPSHCFIGKSKHMLL